MRSRSAAVQDALVRLGRIAAAVRRRLEGVPLHFDLAELRGYHYKTGIVFAAFAPGHGQELARGGRYDEVSGVYGKARPATGFSADLKTLIRLSGEAPYQVRAILAPYEEDSALDNLVGALRAKGERVVCALPGQAGNAGELGCDRELKLVGGVWCVEPLSGTY